MAEDPVQVSRWPPSEVSERHERFAAFIRTERAAILAAYADTLEVLRSPVIAESRACDQAMTDAAQIIVDVAASAQGNDIRSDGSYETPPWMIGTGRTESQLSPADLLRAATALFGVTVSALASHVKDDPELLPCFTTAIVALNESIGRRIREATFAYTGFLLERVDQANADERRRIARDLHEITSREDQLTTSPRAAMAKDAIAEAMRRLRVVTSELREDSVRSLGKALIQYIDSAAPDAAADVRLRVSGDETWAPSAVIDEAFLILREAIRNALRHGSPRMILIGVAVAPHELHAWVEDDGFVFVFVNHVDQAFTGSGLLSMRERAALLGGRLTIASVPGQGTGVELLVPLSGHSDE